MTGIGSDTSAAPAGLDWRSHPDTRWGSAEKRRSVLVVDDDMSLQTLLRILLTNEGFDVTTARDGRQALEVTGTAGFDVILLDLEMPVMNGREFYRAFRDRGGETPVIIVSAYGAETGQRELGAQASITKPFDPAEVPEVVKSLLTM